MIPLGQCQCGCGQPTRRAEKTDPATGYVKGQPRRFIYGHYARTIQKDEEFRYLEEDRGHGTRCWIWQRTIDPQGYGRLGRRLAHRVVWEKANGPVPDGLELDHLCRVPACVNPDHLEAVTHIENLRRGSHVKLSMETAHAIRAEAKNWSGSQRALARTLAARYGFSFYAVYGVLRGVTWKVAA